jgi:hypothetical protein
MDITSILKRSFQITRAHRALWVFGILLALASGGGGYGGNVANLVTDRADRLGRPFQGDSLMIGPAEILLFVAGLLCVVLILAVVGAIVYYVSETALYRLVDELEGTGARPTARRGFRLGWDRRALRLFLIDLVVGIPLVVGVTFLILLALAPLLLLTVEGTAARAVGVGLTVLLLLLVALAIIVVAVAVSLLSQFWHREAAIAGKGVLDAIRGGVALVRARPRDALAMLLVMFGIGLGWGVVLIPVVLALAALAFLVGGLPAFLVHQVTQAPVVAFLVGVPIGLIVFLVPLVFLSGLYITFTTTAWTLAYRDLKARSTPAPAPGPAGDPLKLA